MKLQQQTPLDPFEVLRRHQEAQEDHARQLIELARHWDSAVRDGLTHLAQTLWPDGHVLGIVPVHHYRLRRQAEPGEYLWWIEYDIPPYDEHRCAVYRVLLTLDAQSEPVLTVQSGTTAYSVAPLTEAALEATLAQAGQDPALVILRQMGEAIE
jgi:hypothetical protein